MNLSLLAYNENHTIKYKIYLKTHEDLISFKNEFIKYLKDNTEFMGEVYIPFVINKLNPVVNDSGISKYTIIVTKYKTPGNISVEECPWIIPFSLENATLNKINNKVVTNKETVDKEFIYDTINKYTYENKKIFEDNDPGTDKNDKDNEVGKKILLKIVELEKRIKTLEAKSDNDNKKQEKVVKKSKNDKVIYIDDFRYIGKKNPSWRYYYYEDGKRKEIKAKNKADLYDRLFDMGYTRLDKKNKKNK